LDGVALGIKSFMNSRPGALFLDCQIWSWKEFEDFIRNNSPVFSRNLINCDIKYLKFFIGIIVLDF
jgi:hypothetical protein